MKATAPIGVFDSGLGGLTILKELIQLMPQYDYMYLGDNARAPYGTRSFETIYTYTLQSVQWLFAQNCPLVILACNTASAKALRSIQQNDLPKIDPSKRVLGIVRPTSEVIGNFSLTEKIGIMATTGTVQSDSYTIEISKFFPKLRIIQEACPMWVALVENNEHTSEGADYFIKKHIHNILEKEPNIDTLLLACTHYPLLRKKIEEYLPIDIKIITQGEIVAKSLFNYLERHPEMESRISQTQQTLFFTTEDAEKFNKNASLFFEQPIQSVHIKLP